MRQLSLVIALSLFALLLCPVEPLLAANTVQALTAYADPAEINIGYRWLIDGDENLNSSCTVRYRKQGDATWLPALPGWRFHPWISPSSDLPIDGIHNVASKAENRFAGSVFWVEPGETYEVELTLSDPDGVLGTNPVVLTTTTWQEMVPLASGRKLYVAPGSGGGTGTADDPFLGLAAAHAAAQPGDVFYLASGIYPPFALTKNGLPGEPICFVGPPDRSAIIDGGGAFSALQLGDNATLRGYWIIERLTLRNAQYGCDPQRVQHVKFRHNIIHDIDNGYRNRRGEGDEFRQSVMDNEVVGDEPWVVDYIGSTEGIQTHGTGVVVAHNYVEGFADGISIVPYYSGFTTPYGQRNNSFDCYGNHATRCGDDGLEIDYVVANARVWRNVVTNCRMGVTNQPLFGGPAYTFRNEIFYLQDAGPGVRAGSAYKLHNGASGSWLLHNTSSKDSIGVVSDMFQNSFLRNNIMMGSTRAVNVGGGGTDDGQRPDFNVTDWDYNAYRAGPGEVLIKFFNSNYFSLASLFSSEGVEANGMEIDYADLVDAIPPAVFGEPGVELADFDLSLASGAPEINTGDVLPNINDPFVTDGQPDLGFLEFGQARPKYGPRPIGDVDLDYDVDAADRSEVRNALGEPAQDHPPVDAFIDGILDLKDLTFVRNRGLGTSGGSGAPGAASVQVELFAPDGSKTLQVGANQSFQLNVRATITGQSLAAVAYTVESDATVVLSGRSFATPLEYVGSAPGQDDLPTALGSSLEVGLDDDPDNGDGLAPGTSLLVEQMTFAGLPSGSIVVSLSDLDAAYTNAQFPDGHMFESITGGAAVTVQVSDSPSLITSDPPADGTLPKTQNNVMLLTFDSAISLPGSGPALSIFGGGFEEGNAFTYSVEPNGVTLKAVEQGPILTDQTWYQVTPTPAFEVGSFTFDLCTLVGDANNSGRVTTADYSQVKAHMSEYTDARYDLNGSGRVTTADYSVVKGNLGHRVPTKP